MTMHLRTAALAFVAAATLLSAPRLAAQETTLTVRRAWLGFIYESRDGALTIERILSGSPAERAGLRAGDVIVRIGDTPASEAVLAELRANMEPGDTVRLRVHRDDDDDERAVAVVAGGDPPLIVSAVPRAGIVIIRSDSVDRTVRALLDSARISLEAVRIPHVRIPPHDSVVTLHVDGRSILVMTDSLARSRVAGHILSDSLLREIESSRPHGISCPCAADKP